MRLSELRDKRIKTLDGETLGRVHEVHCEKGRITALMSGSGSLIERFTARKQGRRIPWEFVKRVEADAVIVAPDPPQRSIRSGGSRSRRGTRQASGRPSKR